MNQNSRYILYKRVARGGMAEIYLGKHIGEDHFQRVCCIKRILPHYAQEHEFVEMFRDEAHICKSLQHANIVRVEGFEEVEGSYAIIMEFINGGDLRTVLSTCEKSGERISVPISVYMAAEAARGLHYAHTKRDEITGKELGIVHRDISPQNILISFEGEVKVTDFGIADAESKETETKPGIVKGKYSYMSPEQITAQAVDARTDVFALGIILWESLAMRRLFHAENEIEII
ncbi:MAG: serine/threonine protein kinase, partial [Oligoflexales bacterium]|nr:serine/threonine protein kinase [Oligoflexales bacterium]